MTFDLGDIRRQYHSSQRSWTVLQELRVQGTPAKTDSAL